MPPQGTTFYRGLRIGDGELGLTADAQVSTGDTSRILIHIEVEDVDEALGRVVVLGGQVSRPANDMPWGQRVGHIKDPDGNAVNLAQAI